MTGQLPETSELFDCQNPQLVVINALGKAFTLRRAWPRAKGHLLLEYVTETGEILPGQWFADEAKMHKVAKQIDECCSDAKPEIINAGDRQLLLQPNGADRKLLGLHDLLKRDNSTLVSHRPERRAVMRLDNSNDVRFAKIVKPSKLNGIVETSNKLQDVSKTLAFTIPKLLEVDENAGTAYFSLLEGTCLYNLLPHQNDLVPASTNTGNALRSLHKCEINNLSPHNADDEIQLLNVLLDFLQYYNPQLYTHANAVKEIVINALRTDDARSVPIHRDFYDKQIMTNANDDVGILDFDTLAMGEPELDIANMLVHLELRVLQKVCIKGKAQEMANAFLNAYSTDTINMGRVEAYSNATRLRLACLYSYRPKWSHLSNAILANIDGSGE